MAVFEKYSSSIMMLVLTTCTIGILGSCTSLNQNGFVEQPAKVGFNEIWAYLMYGEEKELTGLEPFTDICYFSANLTTDGRITDTVTRPVLTQQNGAKPRIHLVIAEPSNASLMHFSLDTEYGVTPMLINDICQASQDFDGVQIDFESVLPNDAEHFLDFLKKLRAQLPVTKMLSIAVPARTTLISDAYIYSEIAPIVDRMVIMAYDEHWSSSSPGPVASLQWCSKVLDFATSTVEVDKIIMGLPLYGRAWQDKRLQRALGFQKVQDLAAEKGRKTSYESELGPYFEYSENVGVKVFYEDGRSIMEKLLLYKSKDIKSVSFWRIGLGPSDVWNSIENAGLRNMSAVEGLQTELPQKDR